MGTIPDFLHRVLRIQRDGTLEGYTLEGQNVTFTTCQYNYKSTTCPAWNKMDMVLLRKTLFHSNLLLNSLQAVVFLFKYYYLKRY